MYLKVKTRVSAPLNEVKAGFNQQLFLLLNPPFPKVKLLQFDGSAKGDVVSLELNFFMFRQIWTSEIVSDEETMGTWAFTDVGRRLPFFLKTWKHRHVVIENDGKTEIIDNIRFTTGTLLTDLIIYPVLFGQFLYRKPVYRSFFKRKKQPAGVAFFNKPN